MLAPPPPHYWMHACVQVRARLSEIEEAHGELLGQRELLMETGLGKAAVEDSSTRAQVAS